MTITFEPTGKPHLELHSFPDINHIKVISHCPHCNHQMPITLLINHFHDWLIKGHLIQNIWPDMPINIRERLITGCCNECWNEIFNDITTIEDSNMSFIAGDFNSTEDYHND